MAQSAKPTMKLWALRPKDAMAPPFHFTGVPSEVLLFAALDEASARHMAAAWNAQAMMPAVGDAGPRSAWEDKDMSTCEEFRPTEPGFVASA